MRHYTLSSRALYVVHRLLDHLPSSFQAKVFWPVQLKLYGCVCPSIAGRCVVGARVMKNQPQHYRALQQWANHLQQGLEAYTAIAKTVREYARLEIDL